MINSDFDYQQAYTLASILDKTKDALTQSEKFFVREVLDDIQSSREITPLNFLEPRDADLSFDRAPVNGAEPYRGTVNVNHSHISKMLPGYEAPTIEMENAAEVTAKAYGTMPKFERSTLVNMVKALKPRTILEIGTHLGLLTNDMMSVSPKDTLAISVDLPKERWSEAIYPHNVIQAEYVDRVIGEPHNYTAPGCALDPKIKDRVALIEADSGAFDFSPFYGSMDVVVVDGNHGYEAAVKDLQTARDLVSPGGIIFVDDVNKMYRNEGVRSALDTQLMLNGMTFYWANFDFDGDVVKGNLAFFLNVPDAIAPHADRAQIAAFTMENSVKALSELSVPKNTIEALLEQMLREKD